MEVRRGQQPFPRPARLAVPEGEPQLRREVGLLVAVRAGAKLAASWGPGRGPGGEELPANPVVSELPEVLPDH